MKVAVIGGGWYGVHIACKLREQNIEVVLFERNSQIISGISGKFGIRLHTGPHYPRSLKTRKSCHNDFKEFYENYSELIVEHDESIYALGKKDANGKLPKVDENTFRMVCQEYNFCEEISENGLEKLGYYDLYMAAKIKEPSIIIGTKLRQFFEQRLTNMNVEIIYNLEIKKIERIDNSFLIKANENSLKFDHIVNSTSFQALLPEQISLPFNLDIVYQPCLALIYEDKQPKEKPFSFIIMDGWFPCIMPYLDSEESIGKKYILTHGKWTIMDSSKTVAEANKILQELTSDFVKDKIKPLCEQEMNRFWPTFAKRFEYKGWQGSVIAKIRTNKEFRSAITFACNDIVYIVPGKVSNVFSAANEVLDLLNRNNILTKENYQYVKGGVLDDGMQEIIEKIEDKNRNTCILHSYEELKKQPILNSNENAFKFSNLESHSPNFYKPVKNLKEITEASVTKITDQALEISRISNSITLSNSH